MSEEVVYNISEKMYETLVEWQQKNEERGFEPPTKTSKDQPLTNHQSLQKEFLAEENSENFN